MWRKPGNQNRTGTYNEKAQTGDGREWHGGCTHARRIAEDRPDLYDVTVFGAEPYANYNRILLSPVLAGEQTIKDIMLNDVDWYEENHITLHLGKKSFVSIV
jgi:NAD(P)H-nitrite reductase large subunit